MCRYFATSRKHCETLTCRMHTWLGWLLYEINLTQIWSLFHGLKIYDFCGATRSCNEIPWTSFTDMIYPRWRHEYFFIIILYGWIIFVVIVYSQLNSNTSMLFCCHHYMINRFAYHIYHTIVAIWLEQNKNIDFIVLYTFMYFTLPISLYVYISSYRSNMWVFTDPYSHCTVSPI